MTDPREREGPIPGSLGGPLERVYRAVIDLRNRRFDKGRRVTRAEAPVISIGNISVGGTGKTPLVMWAVTKLRSAGRRPGIVMRGYAARPGELSDEQAEYLDRFPKLDIFVQPNRVAGARELIDRGVDAIVMDDGFQHRFLHRDLDIVLIDAMRSPFEDRCLPAGWLREPVESLARAGAVVLTHCERVEPRDLDAMEGRIREVCGPGTVVARTRHVWDGVMIDGRRGDLSWLRERNVVLACGIGNSQAFEAQVRESCAEIVSEFVYRDHHHWTVHDARLIEDAAASAPEPAAIVTTGKDWVKLRRHRRAGEWPCPVVRPVLSLAFDSGEEDLVAAVEGAVNRARVESAS